MNRRQIYAAIISFLTLVVVGDVANAQSKDLNNPTPLTSDVISGTLSPDKKGDKYYYSFVANPGDVTVTLTVEAENRRDNVVQAHLILYDEREVQLGETKYVATYLGGTAQGVENFNLKKRQRVVVLIEMSRFSAGYGKYRLKVSGPVDFSQNKPTTERENVDPLLDATQESIRSRNKTDDLGKCLPKQGTLVIKMKDGSKKIIDLNEAETITVVP